MNGHLFRLGLFVGYGPLIFAAPSAAFSGAIAVRMVVRELHETLKCVCHLDAPSQLAIQRVSINICVAPVWHLIAEI